MHNLMQDSIMKQKQEAEHGHTSLYLKTNLFPVGMGQFNYCTNYEIYTVLGGRSRNECFIINSKRNGTSETHIDRNGMASDSLTNSM